MSGDLKIVSRDFLRKYQKLGRKYFLKSFFSIIHTLTDRCKKPIQDFEISKIESSPAIVNGFYPVTIVDVYGSPGYA